MTINLSFTPAFAGARNIYNWAQDNGMVTTNWVQTGSWTVPAAPVQHVITSAPVGRSLTVDNTPCTAPCTFQWAPGTSHTIAATTPQPGGSGTQYVFSNWSDGGATSHSITASSSPATYTATFTTQYYLTTAASPGAGGTISPASGWRNSGSVVSVSATANTGYQFAGFAGDLTGTTTPQNLTMNAPNSVTADFTVSNQLPTAVSASPSSGSGVGPRTFQFLYSGPNDYADLASLYGRFGASASDAGACSFPLRPGQQPTPRLQRRRQLLSPNPPRICGSLLGYGRIAEVRRARPPICQRRTPPHTIGRWRGSER